METAILIYLAKAATGTAFFWVLYMLFLRKDKFLHARRIYFLFALLFSLAFPFISFEVFVDQTNVPIYWFAQFDEDVIITAPVAEEVPGYSPLQIALAGGLVIAFVLAILFLVRFMSIIKLRRGCSTININGSKIIVLKDKEHRAFSFFKWIFVPEGYGGQDLQEIITHEQVHIRQLHTIDVLLYELFCIAFWWNPFAWLLKREMKINLEYLADEGVIKEGFDTQAYQYILLQSTNRNTGISIVNNFNVSQLKKRITMMNTKKAHIILSAKYLLALPIAVLLVLGNVAQASPGLIDKTLNSVTERVVDGQGEPNKFINNDFFINYLNTNVQSPTYSHDKNISGKLVIAFDLDTEGNVKNARIKESVEPAYDKKVLAMIESINYGAGKESKNTYILPVVQVGDKLMIEESKLAPTLHGKVANTQDVTDNDKPFVTVEQIPSFPGGEAEMKKFVRDNLIYPLEAQEAGIQGRVALRFIVDTDGTIKDAMVLRGISEECDNEALRVVNTMPKWVPGKQSGKAVPVYFTLPIEFKLE